MLGEYYHEDLWMAFERWGVQKVGLNPASST